jgi:uncharacterized phage infection (PIP) family protein YhgE
MTTPAPAPTAPAATTVDKQVFGMDLKVLGGFAMLIYFGTQQLSDIKNDIRQLKEAPPRVQAIDEKQRAIDEKQRSTEKAVTELQAGFQSMAVDMKSIRSDQQVMLGQINQIINKLPR